MQRKICFFCAGDYEPFGKEALIMESFRNKEAKEGKRKTFLLLRGRRPLVTSDCHYKPF